MLASSESILDSELRVIPEAEVTAVDPIAVEPPSRVAPERVATPSRGRDLMELTKLRLSSLVLVTTALGFVDARQEFVATSFLAALLGTALAAFGANALNQWAERDLDAKMVRTRNRPLPARRMAPSFAFGLGCALIVLGVAVLYVFSNTLAAALAALSALSYVLVYTPLKRTTPHATLVGAIPGALPPVIGYVAATGTIDANAAFLFAILFLWQMPHFYAISWLYRDDYGRAGYPMLAVLDRDGERTAKHALAHLIGLLILSLVPVITGDVALFYGVAALLFGGVFTAAGVAFLKERSATNARRLFHWSLLYLPALLLALVKDTL